MPAVTVPEAARQFGNFYVPRFEISAGGTAIPEPSSIYLLSAGAFILVSGHAARYVLSRLIEHNTPDVCASLHQRTKRAGIA